MARVLLLHANESYAETLATVARTQTAHDIEVVCRVPVAQRLRTLAAREFDLVQVDELLVNGLLATGVAALFEVPLVVAIRGWADYTNAHGQHGWLRANSIRARTRLALHYAAETIFISEATREAFCELYPVDQYSVIGRPIDTARYEQGTDADRETFDLLTVTNLRYEEKYRGVVTVLRALEPLFTAHPSLSYRIAGGGQYLDTLEEFLADYEYAERVTVLGFVDAIEDEFASADAFVYVSFLDSFGTVVLEAQAAGLPVVAGDAVGVPAAVGDAGDLCEPTVEGVRKAIERVVTDDQHRESLARRSREKMATYNEDRVREHVAVWERVLDHS